MKTAKKEITNHAAQKNAGIPPLIRNRHSAIRNFFRYSQAKGLPHVHGTALHMITLKSMAVSALK